VLLSGIQSAVGSVDDDGAKQVGDVVGVGESSRADEAEVASEDDGLEVRDELASGVRAVPGVALPQADRARMPMRMTTTVTRIDRTLTPVQRNLCTERYGWFRRST